MNISKQKMANFKKKVALHQTAKPFKIAINSEIYGEIVSLPSNGHNLLVCDDNDSIYKIPLHPYIHKALENQEAQPGDLIHIICEDIKTVDGVALPQLKVYIDTCEDLSF